MGLLNFFKKEKSKPVQRAAQPALSEEEVAKQEDIKLLKKNKDIFLKHNWQKLGYAYNVLPAEHQAVFNLLPFLLHTNVEGLPGHIPLDRLPVGIYDYQYNPNDIYESIEKLYKKLPCTKDDIIAPLKQRRKNEESAIDSLSLMGSVGSISQGEKSDFDFWVCLNTDRFEGDQLSILQERLTAIEEWSMERASFECHFFITDIDGARNDQFGESDEESSGSAQAKILKEEYFRTVTFVAGKLPFWCVVPVCNDSTYEYYMNLSKEARSFPFDKQFIDLGNTPTISFDEFLGASLWQMNKALGSPFKSVIKMALLDSYTEAESNSALLCDIVKAAIHSGDKNVRKTDPYITVFERTQRFYKSKSRDKALRLLHKCIYLKSAVKILPREMSEKELSPYKELLVAYIKRWNWRPNDVEIFNNFKEWNFKSMKMINDEVNDYLIETYKNFSDKLKEKKDMKVKIHEKDLAILGRKLYTFYAKKPNKVECTSKFMDKNFSQEHLTFFQPDLATQGGWKVYLGIVPKHEILNGAVEDIMIRSGDNLVALCTWLVQNKLFNPQTQVVAISKSSIVGIEDLRGLLMLLSNFVSPLDINSIPKSALLSKAEPKSILVVINMLAPLWAKDITDINLVVRNSWGEVFYYSTSGNKGLKAAVEQIQKMKPQGREETLQSYRFFVANKSNRKELEEKLNRFLKSHIPFHLGRVMFYQR